MIGGKSILAVVPARGGSKGVKLKNLRCIGGIPLVSRVADVIKQLSVIDRAVVSSDHEEIIRVAQQSGLAAPFRRPESLSGDCISDFDVLQHALREMESVDQCIYDVVVMLQPTSPFRRPEQVLLAINKLVSEGRDSVWTVSPTDSKSHPLKQLCVDANGNFNYYDPAGKEIIARQQLDMLYHRNGVAYAITRECLIKQHSIKGENSAALIIPEFQLSIDTEEDIRYAEWFFQADLETT